MLNPDGSRVELYRIPDDPMEINNLAEAEAERAKVMKAKVLAWQKGLPAGPVEPAAGKNDWKWPNPA